MIEIVKWVAIFIVFVAVLSSPLGPVAIGAVIIIAVVFIIIQRGTSASTRVITSIVGGVLLLIQYEQYQKKISPPESNLIYYPIAVPSGGGSGRCQYAEKTASDGTRCGKKAAEYK